VANPFDLHSVLLAKHAQHVVLVHFPIALFMAGVAFDLLSRGKRGSPLASAAYLNLTCAAVAVIPTFITGVLAWQFALEGKTLKGLLLMHLLAGWCTMLLVWISWWTHWRARKSQSFTLPAYRVPIELLGAGAIALTAHLGGFLTGVNL